MQCFLARLGGTNCCHEHITAGEVYGTAVLSLPTAGVYQLHSQMIEGYILVAWMIPLSFHDPYHQFHP